MKNFLRYFFGGLFLLCLLIYISPYGYLLPGLAKIYGTGHTTAYLDDYTVFDNNLVKASDKAVDWPKHPSYNSIALSEAILKEHENYGSVAYLVIYKDSILHESYYKGYDSQSKSNSFSMSKSMVSAMLGKAIEQGYIKSLDQKMSDFYPQYSEGFAADLTVGDLSSMSTGLDWKEEYYLPINITTESYFTPNLEELMLSREIISPPGKAFIYLSGNTQLLGMVIKKAVGQSLSTYFSENFWQPMEAVEDALWQIDSQKNGMEKAYCCFASNAKDFARFGKLYKNFGKWNDQQILDSTFIALSTRPRFEESPEYGYGWWLTQYNGEKGYAMRGHLGQYVIVFPESDLIVVRLGHLKTPTNAERKEPFYTYLKEGFEMIKNVTQP